MSAALRMVSIYELAGDAIDRPEGDVHRASANTQTFGFRNCAACYAVKALRICSGRQLFSPSNLYFYASGV